MKHAKLLLVSIFAVITATSFTGCGNKTEKNTSKTTTTENGVVTTTTVAEQTENITTTTIPTSESETAVTTPANVTTTAQNQQSSTATSTSTVLTKPKVTTTTTKITTTVIKTPISTKATTTAKKTSSTPKTTTTKKSTTTTTILSIEQKEQQAVKSAKEIANLYPSIYPNMLKDILIEDYGYSEYLASYATNHSNIDWNVQAIINLKEYNYIRKGFWEVNDPKQYLLGLGYSEDTFKYAYNSISWIGFEYIYSASLDTTQNTMTFEWKPTGGTGTYVYENNGIFVYIDDDLAYHKEDCKLTIENPKLGHYRIYMVITDSDNIYWHHECEFDLIQNWRGNYETRNFECIKW